MFGGVYLFCISFVGEYITQFLFRAIFTFSINELRVSDLYGTDE